MAIEVQAIIKREDQITLPQALRERLHLAPGDREPYAGGLTDGATLSVSSDRVCISGPRPAAD